MNKNRPTIKVCGKDMDVVTLAVRSQFGQKPETSDLLEEYVLGLEEKSERLEKIIKSECYLRVKLKEIRSIINSIRKL